MTKHFLYYICLPVLFYPAYFLAANLIDTLLGDQQLINWLYFDSRSDLLKIFFKDWLSSLPIMYIIFYLLIMPIELFSRRILNTSMPFVYIASILIVAGGSSIVGFVGLGLIINSLAVFFMLTSYSVSKFLLFPESKK